VAYRRDDGRIGYRCPAEPVEDFLAKGGTFEETVARRCLCNALLADVGFPQVMDDGGLEPPLVTSGDDLMTIGNFLDGRERYSAGDVLDYLLAGVR
jgi:nitronate monooxygenase